MLKEPEEAAGASPGSRPAPPVLLAERQGVVFVATSRSVDGLRVPRRYWGTDMGVVAIPAHEEEVRACELLPPSDAGAWPRALPRPDLLSPAVSRLLGVEHMEMSLSPGRDGLKAMLIAPDGQRLPLPIAPKDALGLLAAVFLHAPRGVVALNGSRSGRVLLAVQPAARPHEYRVRLAGAVATPKPGGLSEIGASMSLLEILNESLDRPSGLMLVAGGSSSGRSTTLDLLAGSLLARGRSGGRIGPRRETANPNLPWLADAVTDWPFPESLKEAAPDFVMMERLEGLRHLMLAARLAGTGTLVLAGAPPAEPQALVRRVARELEAGAGPEVPVMVLAQSLLRTVCRGCTTWTAIPAARALRLGFHRWDLEEMERRGGLAVPARKGCPSCAGTGIAGLTGVFSYAGSDGLPSAIPTLREEGWRKVVEGIADVDDVAALPGGHHAMRSLREIAVLAGTTPMARHEPDGVAAAPARPAATRPAEAAAARSVVGARGSSSSSDVDLLVALLRAARAGQPPQPERLEDLARGLAGRALQGDLDAQLQPPPAGFHLARRAVNTAVLSVRIVAALGQSEDAPATATLALLHDIGLLETGIDPGAESAPQASESEIDPHGARRRPATMLRALGITDADLAARIADAQTLIHPPDPTAGRAKSDLRVQAVALASLIDRTWRVARDKVTDLHDVSSLVMAQHGQQFSTLLFRALLRAVPIFPIGCLVELSSGDVARVVAQNEENHFRPRVEITSGPSHASTAERRVVDLARAPFLHILQRVGPAASAPGGRV
jgi:hypothetical protein